MGRGNAQARAAQARARLEAANNAQADIARQALDAVDNGIDPKVAADLAIAAANELDLPKELTPVMIELEREQNRPAIIQESTIATRKIRAKGDFEGPGYVMVVYVDGVPREVSVNDEGVAFVSDSVAAVIVKPTSHFEFAE